MLHNTLIRRATVGLALCLSVVLAACTSAPEPDQVAAAGQPVQSPNDERDYRMLSLANGMQVLLISDEDTQKAAAALDVYVGS